MDKRVEFVGAELQGVDPSGETYPFKIKFEKKNQLKSQQKKRERICLGDGLGLDLPLHQSA